MHVKEFMNALMYLGTYSLIEVHLLDAVKIRSPVTKEEMRSKCTFECGIQFLDKRNKNLS